jgi:pimeloyl-ACP methyl ester carboxylesterase
MRGIAMWPLASRLRAAGFAVEIVDYASIVRGPHACIARVRDRLLAGAADPSLSLLGHSLGGVVAVTAALQAGSAFQGRIVCLGSPLAGSTVARTLPMGARRTMLLGRSDAVLADGVSALPPGCEVAVIAGDTSIGLGRLFHRFDRANDGTVSVDETRLPGLAAHTVVASTHTGLVYSREVARLSIGFLRDGRFPAAAS